MCLITLGVIGSACGPSPHISAEGASPRGTSASPVISSEPAALTAGSSPSLAFSCSSAIRAGAALALVSLKGSAQVVVRDVTDPSHGRTVCTFEGQPVVPRFVGTTTIGYFSQESPNSINGGAVYIADLTAGTSRLVASIPTGLLGASAMAWSPDGRTFTYVANGTTYAPEWHLVTAGVDRVLTTFPTVRPRGTSPDASDIYLSFSGDGKYVALVENWVAGVSNDQANVQVRDGAGRLLYARHDATMPTWSSQYLYLWDTGAGGLRFWEPGQPQLGAVGLAQWIRPSTSPDGNFIAYTSQLAGDVHHVRLYDITRSVDQQLSPAGRTGAIFLKVGLVWYAEESPCPGACDLGGPPLTGRTFIYDIEAKTESVSVIGHVFDTWPHLGVGRRALP